MLSASILESYPKFGLATMAPVSEVDGFWIKFMSLIHSQINSRFSSVAGMWTCANVIIQQLS